MEAEKEIILGIDLGTTNSSVGIMKNEITILPEIDTNNRIIPSMVCFKDNKCYIGETAKKLMVSCPESSLYGSKRLIGIKYSNSHVQNDIELMKPLKIIEKNDKPKYVIKVNNEDQEYSPEEVSSMILQHLKEIAMDYENNENIKKAVIAVPAHFNDLQRQATIEAANKAGLEVIQLINEPTAAAITYGVQNDSNKERKVLIFDIGGGTFDVSIVKIKGNEYEVLGCDGEGHLGGEYYNQRLFNYIKKRLFSVERNESNYEDLEVLQNEDYQNKKNLKKISQIKEQIESLKTTLSRENFFPFNIEHLDGNNTELKITRRQFEELCMDLWEKCIKIIKNLIEKKKIDKKDINEIILVGGSTRIPKIKQMVEDFFEKQPYKKINQEEVVAYGATLAISNNLIIKDTISKAIGVLIQDKLSTIIPSGAVIPKAINNDFINLKYLRNYYIQRPEITEFKLKICEGNEENEKNILKEYPIKVNRQGRHSIIVSIIIESDSKIKVKVEVNEKEVKNDTFEIKFF